MPTSPRSLQRPTGDARRSEAGDLTDVPSPDILHDMFVVKLAALEKLQRTLRTTSQAASILTAGLDELRRIFTFQSAAFLLVHEETGEFLMRHEHPPEDKLLLQQIVDDEIEAGTFAWALRQSRPIFIRHANTGQRVLLCALSSPQRVLGMFIALLSDEHIREAEDVVGLISIALLAITYTLEMREVESDMRDYNDRLRSEVETRTAELAEANRALTGEVLERQQREVELRDAKSKAEEAVKAKNEFLAFVCHELRTPLTGIHGCTSLLEMSSLSDEQAEYVRLLNVGANQLQTLLNDLLDLSKIEAGALQLEETAVSLRDLVSDLIQIFAVQAQEKRIALSYDIDDALPSTIIADPTRLRQLLLNLLSNACKFTERGEISLQIERFTLEENGKPAILWSVEDTGVGIPKDKLDRLFKPFVQADASTFRKYGGTGLGLAICRRLAEQMGGSIWAESSVSRGSTFRFTTILTECPDPALHSRRLESPEGLANRGVLIFSPLRGQRRTLARQLIRWGAKVQEVDHADALTSIGDSTRLIVFDLDPADPALLENWHSCITRYPEKLLLALCPHKTDTSPLLPDGDLHRVATLLKPLRPEMLHAALSHLLAPAA